MDCARKSNAEKKGRTRPKAQRKYTHLQTDQDGGQTERQDETELHDVKETELHDVEAVQEHAGALHEAPSTLPSTAVREKGYRADIDGLRAVAVVAVIIFHFDPRRLPGGFVGVDVL